MPPAVRVLKAKVNQQEVHLADLAAVQVGPDTLLVCSTYTREAWGGRKRTRPRNVCHIHEMSKTHGLTRSETPGFSPSASALKCDPGGRTRPCRIQKLTAAQGRTSGSEGRGLPVWTKMCLLTPFLHVLDTERHLFW